LLEVILDAPPFSTCSGAVSGSGRMCACVRVCVRVCVGVFVCACKARGGTGMRRYAANRCAKGYIWHTYGTRRHKELTNGA